MITLESNEFKLLILQSAALRGAGRFKEAIDLIEKKLPEMHANCFQNAYLEVLYAAIEGQFQDQAFKYAKKLNKIDPDIPKVKEILKKYSKQ